MGGENWASVSSQGKEGGNVKEGDRSRQKSEIPEFEKYVSAYLLWQWSIVCLIPPNADLSKVFPKQQVLQSANQLEALQTHFTNMPLSDFQIIVKTFSDSCKNIEKNLKGDPALFYINLTKLKNLLSNEPKFKSYQDRLNQLKDS